MDPADCPHDQGTEAKWIDFGLEGIAIVGHRCGSCGVMLDPTAVEDYNRLWKPTLRALCLLPATERPHLSSLAQSNR